MTTVSCHRSECVLWMMPAVSYRSECIPVRTILAMTTSQKMLGRTPQYQQYRRYKLRSNLLHYIWNPIEHTVYSFQIGSCTKLHTDIHNEHSMRFRMEHKNLNTTTICCTCKIQLQHTWYIPVPHFPARYPGCHMPFAGQTH